MREVGGGVMVILVPLTVAEVEGLAAGGAGRIAAADLVPDVVARAGLERRQSGEDWFWCAPRLFVDPTFGLAVGSACFKGLTGDGSVEIGYGVAEDQQGKGYATVGVAALIREAWAQDGLESIRAESSLDNRASERVLEHNGFVRVGKREDAEDGWVTCWELKRPR